MSDNVGKKENICWVRKTRAQGDVLRLAWLI